VPVASRTPPAAWVFASPAVPSTYRRNPSPSRQFDPRPWRTLPKMKSGELTDKISFGSRAHRKPVCKRGVLKLLPFQIAARASADEVIECQKIAAMHESVIGTKRTCRLHWAMSVLRGERKTFARIELFRFLTQLRHWRRAGTINALDFLLYQRTSSGR